MFKHIWSVLCRNSVIDNETNNISLNSVFEQLTVDIQKPEDNRPVGIPIEYEIVSFWSNQDSEKERRFFIDIEVSDPQGKSLQKLPQTVIMPIGIRRTRARFRIQGLGLTTSGNYIFTVKFKETENEPFKKAAEIPLEVKINFISKTKIQA